MSLQVKFPFGRGHGPLHTCGTCGFMTRHRAMYDRHLKRCGGNKSAAKDQGSQGPSQDPQLPSPPVCRNYRCEKCGFATSRSKVYLQHRREMHGENFSIYPCDQCEYASRHKSKVIRHRGLVHKNAPEDPDFPHEIDVAEGSTPKEFTHASSGLVSLLSGRKIGTAIYQASYNTAVNEDEDNEQNMMPDENQNTPVKKPLKTPERAENNVEGQEKDTVYNFTFSSPEDVDRSPNATRIPDPTENAYDYIASIVKNGDAVSHRCTLCVYSNIHKWKVATHVRTVHMRKTLFKCPYCEFVTERKIEWCVHKTTHTEKVVHSCHECSYRTTMKRNFERHQAHHSLGGPFKCSMCSYSSSGEAAVQRHMAEYHPSPDKQLAIDSIHTGSNKFNGASSKSNKTPAIVTPPPRPQPNQHPLSDSVVSVRRRTSNAPRQMTAASPSEVQCSICQVWFKNETRLRIHMVAHSSEAPHVCPVCELRYKRPADLNRHMKRKHGAKIEDFKSVTTSPVQEQPLDLCLKKSDEEEMDLSDSDQPLDLSMKPPPAANTYRPHEMKCSYCSYMAKWPSDLRRHMLVHSIEKRFRCPHCSKKYKYQFDLNMHMRKTHRIHTGKTRVSSSAAFGRVVAPPTNNNKVAIKQEPMDTDYPKSVLEERQLQPKASPQVIPDVVQKQNHQCPHCSYVGKCQSEVERHKLIHTGQKPFLCLFCAYRTSWKGDIKSHLLKQHNTEVEKYGELPELVNLCYKPQVDLGLEEDTEKLGDEHEDEDQTGTPTVPSPVPPQTEVANLSGQEAASVNDMSEYVKEVAGKKIYQCPKCSVNFDFPSKLKNHMEVHENIKKYMCPHCGKRSNWQWDIRKHITSQHPNLATDVITLTDAEARATLQEYLNTMRQSPPKALPESKRSSEAREVPELDTVQGLDDYARVMNIDNLEPEPLKEKEVYRKPHSLLDSIPGGGFSSLSSGGSVNSLIATVAAGRYRRFKCSKCGKRSNWKWDIKKHIRHSHPSASMVEMTEDEAKETFHEVLQNTPKPKQPNFTVSDESKSVTWEDPMPEPTTTNRSKYRPFKCTWCGKRSNWKWDLKKHLMGCDRNARMTVLSEEEAKATFDEECSVAPRSKKSFMESPVKTPPKTHRVTESTSPKVKKYKCSLCPYRSDYRSDISRHLKRKHDRRIRGKILVLGSEYAASTLTQYKETWGRKKFVISAEKVHEIEQQQQKNSEELDNCVKIVEVDQDSDEEMMDEEQKAVADTKSNDTTTEPFVKPTTQVPVVSPSTDKQMNYSKVWQCTKCEFQCRNKMTVIAHYRTHGHGQPFKCNICGYSSDYRGSIYRHVKHKHKRRDYQNVITYMALREVEDSSSSRTTTPSPKQVSSDNNNEGTMIKMFQCLLCTSRTVHKHNLIRHIKEKHPQATDPQKFVEQVEVLTNRSPNGTVTKMKTSTVPVNNNVKKLKCNLCPFETIKHGLLKIHQSYHKPKSNEHYKCNYCPYYVTTLRRLLKHTRLHLQEDPTIEESKDAPKKIAAASPSAVSASPSATKTTGKMRHYCDKCPYISINKNDFIYHKQFHRPKPTAPYKCDICPYWVSLRRLLTQHQKVHSPEYKLQYYPKESSAQEGSVSLLRPLASPAKSEVSHLSMESNDMVEVAGLKQQIISARVTSVPVSPEKLSKPDLMDKADDNILESYVIDSSSNIINNKSYRKIHQCRYCPYKNVRTTNLRLHEKMHERVKKNKELHKCHYCNYRVGNKGLLAHHMIVHSSQYQPTVDNVNDVEAMDENGEFIEGNEKPEEDEDKAVEEDEKNNNVNVHVFPERATIKSNVTTKLQIGDLPNKSEYYIKMDHQSGQPILEKATLKKWCCDRCPYATMKKSQFEKHLMLHGSKQKYPCEYCDYSVPGYHLLLQHKKLHTMPNANLLSVQSISNLQRLPEVPADIAAAADQPCANENLKYGTHDNMPFYENSKSFVEPKKLYRCDRCPYTNIRRDHLLSHLKFHMINSDLRCPYCDYSVSKVHLLNQHIRVHFSTPGTEMSSEPKEENTEQPDFFAALKLKQNNTAKAKPNANRVTESKAPRSVDVDAASVSGRDREDRASIVTSDIPVYQTPAQEEPMSLVTKTTGNTKKPDEVTATTSDEADELPQDLSLPKALSASDVGRQSAGTAVLPQDAARPDKSSCRYCDRYFGSQEKKNLHERHHLVGNC